MVKHGSLSTLVITYNLIDEIKEAERKRKDIEKWKESMAKGKRKCLRLDEEGILWFGKRIVVPKSFAPRRKILDEAHESHFSIGLGSNKMYEDFKKRFWWYCMKKEVARYV